MQIADKIKFMRQLKDLSQDDVAERLEMSVQGYAKIEQGKTDLPYSRLKQIAKVLEVDELELLSFGEKNVFYFSGNNNQQVGLGTIFNYQSDKTSDIEKLHIELEKAKTLLLEQAKEISHFKSTIDYLVKENKKLSSKINKPM